MSQKSEFTVVIQGPLHKNSISNIEYYKSIGHVVISYWKEEDDTYFSKGGDTGLVDHLRGDPDVTLVEKELPTKGIIPIPKDNIFGNRRNPDYDRSWAATDKLIRENPGCHIFNEHFVYVHCLSTLNGVRAANSDYIIKVRADEKWGDLSPFVDRIRKSPNKMITTPIAFTRDAAHKFHASDHAFCMSRENALRAMEIATSKCENPPTLPRFTFNIAGNMVEKVCASEVIITTSFLEAVGEKIDWDNSIKIMRENVEMVHLSEFGDILYHVYGHGHVSDHNFKDRFADCTGMDSLEELGNRLGKF